MIYLEMLQKIEQQLAELSPDQLTLVSDFLDSIQSKDTTLNLPQLRRLPPIKRGKKASDLLQLTDTWQGNDMEECLRFVHETRSKAKF